MKRAILCAAAALLSASSLAAQESGIGAPCEDAAFVLSGAEQRYCFAVAQAAASAQPQLGILIAGGNPTLGSNSTGMIRLGVLPRFSTTLQLSAALVRLPDIEEQSSAITEQLEFPAPALSGTVAVGIFSGFGAAPGVGGIGSVDLLGSATWLPFKVIESEGFAQDASEFAYGVGARVGLLRESFTTPAVAVSLMYRRLDRIQYGDVCPRGAGAELISGGGDGYDLDAGFCAQPGDDGEFAFDLTDWSGRATISKRLAGFGLAGGVGYDRFRSDVDFGLGATPDLPLVGVQPVFVRASNLEVESDRWSAFVNGSYSVFLAGLVAEAGWMQGGGAIRGFDAAASEFDPEGGTFFGSVGLRLGL